MTQQLHVLANLVRDNSKLLLSRWRVLVRELESAKHLDIPTLNDHVPVLIVDIANAFDRFGEVPSGSRNNAASVSPNAGTCDVVQNATESADIHGEQRLHAGFDLEEVVAEYGIFRDVLIELLDENQLRINPARLNAINSVMDVAIARAVQTYAKHREEQLREAHQKHLLFVTHDLRSPLQAISLAVARLELQSRLGQHDPAMSRLAGTLQRSSDRLLALVNEIMKTDDEDDTQIASVREVELWIVVERLIAELTPLAEQRSVQLSNEVPDGTFVNFDPMMLERVLQNLISNAIKYQPIDNQPIINISYRENEAFHFIEIKDNGIGISPEHQHKIFQIFQRLHSKDQYPGTGIGLANCKKIVELHNGQIWVESTPDKGSTFYFTILTDI